MQSCVLGQFGDEEGGRGGEGGACVEVAADRAAIRVRDSKEHDGPQLAFAPDAWTGFVAHAGRVRSN
ncbi:DUF397 domain-containing protein [Streptomyces sp. DG2A-72]|uniref:DUF397 domain-containing protein n=1 Tax=Streptomyces sp. DG2A-72 TaxID=3051386 RepID=UPI00265BBF50|nr:DUF397 domain-containing protein [Streptomyces sp. DG2A-72]MDO0933215.1 DUF397 domain-containing protein [Streptomyces sp. DG2A-72]